MYHSGSDSDVSGANDADAPHHPLPSPPRDPKYQSIPPPVLPSHNQQMMRQQSLSRPLPQVPDGEYGDENDLYGEVEGALYGMGSAAQSEGDAPHRGLQRNGTNGRLDPRIESVYDYYSDSDPEGNAGLAMMRLDEELAERRGSAMSTLPPPPEVPPSMDQEDSDQEWPVDIDMYGAGAFGGYYGGFGKDVDNSLPLPPPPLVPAKEGQGPASEDMTDDEKFELQKQLYAIPDDVDVHPFPQFHTEAEDREFEPVMTKSDTWGTGGLAAPAEVAHMAQKLAKRMSFDEGDEAFDRSGSGSPAKDSDDDIPELFYHPPPSSNSPVSSRPLPSPPTHDYNPELRPAGSAPLPYPTQMYGSQPNSARNSYGSYGSSGSPSLLGNMSLGSQQTYIPRTGSLNSPPSAPVANAPVRSKTDGRVHPKLNRASMVIPAAQDLTPGDLPAIPVTRKFDPKKLSTRDFRRCTAPWALSSISAWLKVMTEGEQDLKEAGVADAVAALFTHYVPTMNVADAETLAARVVDGMLKEKNLVEEEEWVKFGPGEVSGVIYQITGNGCYAPRLHNQDSPARCYAHHCARTLRKISLPQGGVEPNQVKEDWATYWKIKKEDMVDVHKKEVERQNNLHEIVQTEEEFMEHMKILKLVYRDQIAAANPSIIKPSKLDAFVKEVFGMSDAVRKVSEEHLLPQLKFRQREQGPWIMGFSDIFREWIRKAKVAYLDYAAAFPKADMMMRRERERNMVFKKFLEDCRADPRTRRLDWNTFLKAPITRLQRYSLLLSTVLKHTITESEEKHNLELAIEEIRAVTQDCDTRVDENSKFVEMYELGNKLIMRQWPVDLRLEEKGRELIFKGDLQRTGSNRFTWLETHCILFDHYFVLAKTQMQKEIVGGAKHERYDVSRMPIPMYLLVLESTDDDPVTRTPANRLGIAGPASVNTTSRSGRYNSTSGAPMLTSTNTSSSVSSTATAPGRLVTSLPDQNGRDDKILYPFRIKHLGNPTRVLKTDDNTYTLYAPSAANRKDWCDKIILAKEKHAASLHAQNEEPFRLNIMADSAFGYESTTAAASKPIRIRGTPLDRAICEVEKRFEGQPKPPVVCRASVNCATAFTAPHGREMVAIGTDYGVFVADADNPRGWTRAVNLNKVTQIAVLEEFSLFLILADKALVAYHLDVICPAPGQPVVAASKQKSPQRLAKDVGFFATGKMKDRMLVFYKKRDGLTSTFKVCVL